MKIFQLIDLIIRLFKLNKRSKAVLLFLVPTFLLGQNQAFWLGKRTTGAPTNLLLDDYPGAAAAYSVRKLDKDYTGFAMEIRRASDNATQNIGFVGEDLDVTSINTFCSGTTCTVRTWYDQSGNSNNALQTTLTSQPEIYSSGVIIKDNNKPALNFNGSNYFSLLTILSLFKKHSLFSVANNNNKPISVLYGSTSPVSNFNSDNLKFTYNANGTFVQVSGFAYGQKMLSILRNDTQTINFYQNTISYSGIISNNYDFTIKEIARRSDLSEFMWDGQIQEIIIYPFSQVSNRTLIENNINSYYSIY